MYGEWLALQLEIMLHFITLRNRFLSHFRQVAKFLMRRILIVAIRMSTLQGNSSQTEDVRPF